MTRRAFSKNQDRARFVWHVLLPRGRCRRCDQLSNGVLFHRSIGKAGTAHQTPDGRGAPLWTSQLRFHITTQQRNVLHHAPQPSNQSHQRYSHAMGRKRERDPNCLSELKCRISLATGSSGGERLEREGTADRGGGRDPRGANADERRGERGGGKKYPAEPTNSQAVPILWWRVSAAKRWSPSHSRRPDAR